MKHETKLTKKLFLTVISLILIVFSVILSGCTYVSDADFGVDSSHSESDSVTESEETSREEMTEPYLTDEETTPETEPDESEETEADDTTAETHEHVYIDATCTAPSVCIDCGDTVGEALGHDFADADCTSPKRCKRCGETLGEKAEHTYVDGKCSVCGQSDPEYKAQPNDVMVWIPTKGGKKYHSRADCSNMDDPDYVTLSEAIALGFEACKRCH